MTEVRVSAIEFLRMCESGSAWPLSRAVDFIKTCREHNVSEYRISQPERGRDVVVSVPDYPVWIDDLKGED